MTWPPWEKEVKNMGHVHTSLHGLDLIALLSDERVDPRFKGYCDWRNNPRVESPRYRYH
jgi:hypothetical protein